MNLLKTAFAMLASVLLVGSQPVFAFVQTAAAVPQECTCCNCKQTDCCIAPSEAPAPPVPAAPVRTVSQNALQLLAVITTLILPLPEIAPSQIASTTFLSPYLTAVPLYEWNCSYLI